MRCLAERPLTADHAAATERAQLAQLRWRLAELDRDPLVKYASTQAEPAAVAVAPAMAPPSKCVTRRPKVADVIELVRHYACESAPHKSSCY